MDGGELTRRERLVALTLSLAVAATRLAAVSRTLWDWDEALFGLALRHYDVAAYHPHPPGFPLFIGAAKLLTLAGVDGFHALQALSVAASLFVFPAMFFLARRLHASFFAACASGLFLAFLPNVWLFGGTAFSDVPSMVLSLVACGLLLGNSRRDLYLGALVAGLAAGVRPQNLIIVAAPFVVAFFRRRRDALVAALIVVVLVAVSYGAAIHATGWELYRDAVARHSSYIRQVDSFLSPSRPSLLKVFDDFFLWPYRAPAINIAIALLALAGLLRAPKLVLAIFGPFLLFAWLYLDFHSSSRFSIAYMPLYAFLAACGAEQLRRARGLAVVALVAWMMGWTWPALRVVRTTDAPPVAACEWIRRHVARGSTIYIDERLGPHAALLLPDYDLRTEKPPAGGWYLVEGGAQFTRDRARLARAIVRPRYFEVSVSRLEDERLRQPGADALPVLRPR